MLAGSLLTQRLAQHRVIIFKHCGNCLQYAYNSNRIIRSLKERNVQVYSIGNYNIENLEDLGDGDKIFAYDDRHVYYITAEGDIDRDDKDSFKIDHRLDMCARLAVKTGGKVISMAPETAVYSLELALKQIPARTYKVGTCERLNTPIGDFTDFSYTRTSLPQEDEDDYDY